ncbi:uncharacterized protein J3D65DRAFT_374814 [Phyllosticta citribraziliensis]|uniref:Uncharacterized protein n=1 Tax=Phyllosticta citribraziliensis TaxID=989973 RepID=A0ABR1LRI0_9PEZI
MCPSEGPRASSSNQWPRGVRLASMESRQPLGCSILARRHSPGSSRSSTTWARSSFRPETPRPPKARSRKSKRKVIGGRAPEDHAIGELKQGTPFFDLAWSLDTSVVSYTFSTLPSPRIYSPLLGRCRRRPSEPGGCRRLGHLVPFKAGSPEKSSPKDSRPAPTKRRTGGDVHDAAVFPPVFQFPSSATRSRAPSPVSVSARLCLLACRPCGIYLHLRLLVSSEERARDQEIHLHNGTAATTIAGVKKRVLAPTFNPPVGSTSQGVLMKMPPLQRASIQSSGCPMAAGMTPPCPTAVPSSPWLGWLTLMSRLAQVLKQPELPLVYIGSSKAMFAIHSHAADPFVLTVLGLGVF